MKDYGEAKCQCGRVFTVPYHSLQKSPAIAPTERELKQMSYALTQELIYHQNHTCPWMHNERIKAKYATKPPTITHPL